MLRSTARFQRRDGYLEVLPDRMDSNLYQLIATYSNKGNSVLDPFGITSSARRLNFAPPSSPPGSVLGKQGGCMEPDFTISPWHRWIFQCQHIKPRGTTWPAKQSSKLCSKKYQRILDGM